MKAALATLMGMIVVGGADVSRAQPNAEAPQAAVALWTFLVGDWNVEGTVGGAQVSGTASYQWAAGKHCCVGKQVWQLDGGNVVHLTSIEGWDPVTEEVVEHGFGSAGSTATIRFKMDSSGEAKGLTEGTITMHTRRPGELTAEVKLERKGADEFTLTTTTPSGNTLHRLTFHRMKK